MWLKKVTIQWGYPQGSWEAPTDANKIHSCGDTKHLKHALGWQCCHFGEGNSLLKPVLGLAETRWTQLEEVKFASGHFIMYCTHEERRK